LYLPGLVPGSLAANLTPNLNYLPGPVAITGISHGYSLFTRGVTGGMPVIMASTWNYLSGRRQLLPVSAIFIVCPGIARRPAGDHGTNLKLSTREPIPVTGYGHDHCLFTWPVAGGLPVIMVPTWNYLPDAGGGYRY